MVCICNDPPLRRPRRPYYDDPPSLMEASVTGNQLDNLSANGYGFVTHGGVAGEAALISTGLTMLHEHDRLVDEYRRRVGVPPPDSNYTAIARPTPPTLPP